MRAVFLFFVALFLGACCSTSGKGPLSPVPSTTGAATLTSKTVALVDVDEEDGNTRAFCTGVWVGPKTILTAAHCVEQSPLAGFLGVQEHFRYAVRSDIFVNGSEIEAKYPVTHEMDVTMRDEAHDLALLEAKGQTPSHEIAELGANPEQGAHVEAMGHSKGLWWSYSSGDVAAIRFAPLGSEPMTWIQTTTPISPGNSGGGLFDEQGKLVGICSRGLSSPRAQNINFFAHTDYIRALLEGPKP